MDNFNNFVVLLLVVVYASSDEIAPRLAVDLSNCPCYTDEHDPICASNGNTYTNTCYLKCAQKQDGSINGLCHGTCPCCSPPYQPKTFSDPEFYDKQILPQSSSQGNSLLNDGNAKSSSSESGAAPVVLEIEGCPCDKRYKPVCGSDNVTYGNPCVFECQQKIVGDEACLSEACPGECPCCSCSKVSET